MLAQAEIFYSCAVFPLTITPYSLEFVGNPTCTSFWLQSPQSLCIPRLGSYLLSWLFLPRLPHLDLDPGRCTGGYPIYPEWSRPESGNQAELISVYSYWPTNLGRCYSKCIENLRNWFPEGSFPRSVVVFSPSRYRDCTRKCKWALVSATSLTYHKSHQ